MKKIGTGIFAALFALSMVGGLAPAASAQFNEGIIIDKNRARFIGYPKKPAPCKPHLHCAVSTGSH